MGIFDIIELKNHCQAINEYIIYLDSHRQDKEIDLSTTLMIDHLKKMVAILDKIEKST